MIKKESKLLEEAYLSIQKSQATVPSDDEEIPMSPEDLDFEEPSVSVGPDMAEPAPGSGIEVGEIDPALNTTNIVDEPASLGGDELGDLDAESEEDAMVIDNLNSIRESITKTADYCAGGGHLEPWQQQKLAIAMDNLAHVARSLR